MIQFKNRLRDQYHQRAFSWAIEFFSQKVLRKKQDLEKPNIKKEKNLKNCNLNDRINKIDMVCRYNRINRIDQASKNQTALNQVPLTSFVQFWFFLVLDIDSNAVRIKNTVQASLFLIGNKLVYTVFV